MQKRYDFYIKDILDCIKNIENYTKNMTFTEFKSKQIVIDAVTRNLEVIGEAAKKIPLEIRKKYGEIEWKKISGLRDILIHEYSYVDLNVVWDILKNKVPELKKKIKAVYKELSKLYS